MGYLQGYRGDPTVKNYYLMNSFDGGVNTKAVDEKMRDDEFRELLNVDIGLEGALQSRKGWKEITKIKDAFDLIQEGRYPFTFEDVYYFRILENKSNTLEKYIKDENGYDALKILVGAENKFYIIWIHEDGDMSLLQEVLELPEVSNYNSKGIINVKTQDYVNNIYFSLNDISLYYKGILIFDRDNETFSVINGYYINNSSNLVKLTESNTNYLTISEPYQVKPYDISSVSDSSSLLNGFNVLAESPLLDIGSQETGLNTVRNVLLDEDGVYLKGVVSDETININVLKTGTLKPGNYRIVIRDSDGNKINYILYSMVDNGGYFTYRVVLPEITSAYVFIDVLYQDYVIYAQNNPKWVFIMDSTNQNAYPYDEVSTNTSGITPAVSVLDYPDGIVVRVFDGDIQSPHYYWYEAFYPLPNGKIYNDNTYFCLKDENIVYKYGSSLNDIERIDVKYVYETTSLDAQEPEDSGVFSDYMSGNYDGDYFLFKTNNTFKLYTYSSIDSDFVLVYRGDLYDSYDQIFPSVGSLILSKGSSGYDKYYYYYDLDDFKVKFILKEEIDLTKGAVDLEGQYFEVYDNLSDAQAEEIEGLDLTDGLKMQVANNKMMYYKGNTIYFSADYQFDYVPNYAFLILPLLSTDEIVRIKYFRGSWIIFTKETIWKMTGTYGDSDWEVQRINTSIGCIAPDSIVSIENSLYFLSRYGLYKLYQTYYQEGFENVLRMDKNIINTIPIDEDIVAFLYNNQYIMFMPEGYDYDAIRMYYNIDLKDNQHPFVFDKYVERPELVSMNDGCLLGVKEGRIYAYDNGYSDFYPKSDITESEDDYLYTVRIKTGATHFGYPTHDKKVKSIFIKTKAETPTYLFFKVWVDGYLKIQPTNYRAYVNEQEEVVYEEYIDYGKDSNINLSLSQLGNFEIGTDILGDNENATHKLTMGFKGKTFQIEIEQKSNANFAVVNLGYLFKLGKVKEQR